MYCEVILEKTSRNLDKKFIYKVDKSKEKKIKIGMRVIVDFNGQIIEALVVNLTGKTDISEERLKYIKEILDDYPIINSNSIELIDWMREFYVCRYLDAAKLFYPPSYENKIQYIFTLIKEKDEMNNIEKIIIENLREGSKSFKYFYEKFNDFSFLKEIYTLWDKENLKIEYKDASSKPIKYVKLLKKFKDIEDYKLRKNASKQIKILQYILDIDKEIKLNDLMLETNSSLYSVNSLKKKEIIDVYIKDNIIELEKRGKIYNSKVMLNLEQKEALKKIRDPKNQFNLIHGVTGSGKTEIYMEIIEDYIKVNKKIIMLFPEISLTNHMINRFKKRFNNRIALVHSRMSAKERYEQWDKINKGSADIVIGARSALFSPVRNLGAIIVDEEHDDSYNSSMTPKYKTIEIAEKMANITGCKLVLGSATPSVLSYYKAKTKKYNLINIKKRVNNIQLPVTHVVDMKSELDEGNKSIFSRRLYNEIKKTLARKEQVILFINKRGHSSFISCRKCGYVIKCSKCDVSMTYHSSIKKLICHYCGETQNPPRQCPKCNSKYIKTFGIGTQKVENITKKMFPDKVIDRMDFDTVTKKGVQERIYKDLYNKKTDILIGTQMLAKGIHFPNVTLVGIISADITINLPFYTANEKSFQLITQVSGRSGRGEKKGQVILQTYDPSHYSIEYSIQNNYYSFFMQEILLRKEFKYPPFIKILYINTKSKNEDMLKDFNNIKYQEVIKKMDKFINKGFIKVYKPVPKGIYKINNEFQIDTIIKTKRDQEPSIKKILRKIYFNKSYKNISISIEINPNTIT